jgi:hypothetical protein
VQGKPSGGEEDERGERGPWEPQREVQQYDRDDVDFSACRKVGKDPLAGGDERQRDPRQEVRQQAQ